MKKNIAIISSALMMLSTAAFAQKAEELGATPQMGWSTWNKFGCNIEEGILRETADKMVELGLVDAGYVYLNIDDCWHGQRDSLGFIHEDLGKFPSGMKAMADYVHERGMKLGIYSDAGSKTCACFAGSRGHEYQDAFVYAQWGIDYLKYDWCYTEDVNPKSAYRVMRDALAATGRPIFFSMCEWGHSKPWEWAADIAHSWRTTGDIWPYFETIPEEFNGQWHGEPVLTLVDINEPLRAYAGPGHWNDPDMLEVGNGNLTEAENRAHFTLWCMMAAPLILGNDLTTMTQETLDIILNKDVIAIDQDPLGVQGLRLRRDGDVEYWFKPLEGGDWAFCAFNRGKEDVTVTLDWDSFKFTDEVSGCTFDPQGCKVRNLWDAKEKVRKIQKVKNLKIASHDVVLYRISR